jgi:hypothetical protein
MRKQMRYLSLVRQDRRDKRTRDGERKTYGNQK